MIGIAQTAMRIAAYAVVLFSMVIRQFSAMVANCGFIMDVRSYQRMLMKMS